MKCARLCMLQAVASKAFIFRQRRIHCFCDHARGKGLRRDWSSDMKLLQMTSCINPPFLLLRRLFFFYKEENVWRGFREALLDSSIMCALHNEWKVLDERKKFLLSKRLLLSEPLLALFSLFLSGDPSLGVWSILCGFWTGGKRSYILLGCSSNAIKAILTLV